MQRLLDDAEKISGIKYDISSFADITQAIHVMQEEMGIAGATALEAGTTIEGSVNSMKSAWTNLITGLADENADIEQLVDDLVTTIVGDGTENNLGVIGNILPAVETALNGAGKLVENLIPELIDRIPKMLSETIPNLTKAAINTMKSVVKSIGKNANVVVGAAKDLVLDFIDGLVEMLPVVFDAAANLMGEIVAAVPEIAVKLVTAMPQIIDAITKGVAKGGAAVAQAVAGLFLPFDEEFDAAMDKLNQSASKLTPFTDAVNNAASRLVDTKYLLSDTGKSVSELETQISETEAKITESIQKSRLADEGEREEEIKNLRAHVDEYKALVEEKLGVYGDRQAITLRKLEIELPSLDVQGLAARYGEALEARDDFMKELEKSYTAQLSQIEGAYTEEEKLTSSHYQKDLDAVHEWYAGESARAKSVLTQTETLVQSQLRKQIGEVSEAIGEYSGKLDIARNNNEGFLGWFRNNVADAASLFGEFTGSTTKYAEGLTELNVTYGETANAFLTMSATMVGSGEELDTKTQEYINNILSLFEGLPDEYDEVGKSTLLSLIDGMEQNIPGLENASNMSVDGIVDSVKKGLGISENGSKTMETIGQDTVDGLVSGIDDKLPDLAEKSAEVANTTEEGINKHKDTASTWGRDLMSNFISGLKAKWESLKSTVSGIAQSIKDRIGFSEPKLGPLSNFHTFAPDMIDLFIKGIKDNEKKLTDQIEKSFDFGERTIAFDTNFTEGNYTGTYTGAYSGNSSRLDRIETLLTAYLPQLANMSIVTETGTLVGVLSSGINISLGEMQTYSERGNA